MAVALPLIPACYAKEVDRLCFADGCVILSVENGMIFVTDTGERSLRREIGPAEFVRAVTIPVSEVALKQVRSDSGWKAVVTAYLSHEVTFAMPDLRLRVFDPSGRQMLVEDGQNQLLTLQIARLSESKEELLIFSSAGPHAYAVTTSVLLLQRSGKPAQLLFVNGTYAGVYQDAAGQSNGLLIDLETYDGVNSATKGRVLHRWIWSQGKKRLILSD